MENFLLTVKKHVPFRYCITRRVWGKLIFLWLLKSSWKRSETARPLVCAGEIMNQWRRGRAARAYSEKARRSPPKGASGYIRTHSGIRSSDQFSFSNDNLLFADTETTDACSPLMPCSGFSWHSPACFSSVLTTPARLRTAHEPPASRLISTSPAAIRRVSKRTKFPLKEHCDVIANVVPHMWLVQGTPTQRWQAHAEAASGSCAVRLTWPCMPRKPQPMASLVVLECHLREIKETDKVPFLDAPVSPSGLFGPAIEGFAKRFTSVQKLSQAMQHFQPKRCQSPKSCANSAAEQTNSHTACASAWAMSVLSFSKTPSFPKVPGTLA